VNEHALVDSNEQEVSSNRSPGVVHVCKDGNSWFKGATYLLPMSHPKIHEWDLTDITGACSGYSREYAHCSRSAKSCVDIFGNCFTSLSFQTSPWEVSKDKNWTVMGWKRGNMHAFGLALIQVDFLEGADECSMRPTTRGRNSASGTRWTTWPRTSIHIVSSPVDARVPSAQETWSYLEETYNTMGLNKTVSTYQILRQSWLKNTGDASTRCLKFKRLLHDAIDAGHELNGKKKVSSFLHLAEGAGFRELRLHPQDSHLQERPIPYP
jgi:hypothetical protein